MRRLISLFILIVTVLFLVSCKESIIPPDEEEIPESIDYNARYACTDGSFVDDPSLCASKSEISVTNDNLPRIAIASSYSLEFLDAKWSSKDDWDKYDEIWNTLCSNPEKARPVSDWWMKVYVNLSPEIDVINCNFYADGIKPEYPERILRAGINIANRSLNPEFTPFNVNPITDVNISLCCAVNKDDALAQNYDVCLRFTLKSVCNV